MRCDAVAVDLGEVASGRVLLTGADRAHVETCLRCQAELVQYRKLLRALRAMRTEVLEPTPGLLAEVLAAIEEAGERRALADLVAGRRIAYIGGLAAATAAAAGGAAIVLASRSRRHHRLAG